MSSIVSPDNTDVLTQVESPDGGLDVFGQQDEENIIEIKGDAEVGIIGGDLNDVITTGAGDADVFTGDGDDIIMGGTGDDIIRGGDGNDIIQSRLGADIVIGGDGNDVLRGGFGGMTEDGTPLGDTLKGGSGDDVFEFSANEFEDGVVLDNGNVLNNAGVIDEIVDFQTDGFEDIIKIFGVDEDGSVSYDAETGLVSINGQEAIDIGMGLDIDISKNDDTDTYELF